MKVLVFGSTGRIGEVAVTELRRRGHDVIVALRPGNDSSGSADAVRVDPRDPEAVIEAASGTDAIVSVLGGARKGDAALVSDVVPALLAGAAITTTKRLLVVGGAGSLRENGQDVVDAAGLDSPARTSSLAQREALRAYRAADTEVDWAYLSPSNKIEPGEPTGDVELGSDELLRGEDGESRVTYGDFVAALVDELETPAHHRTRFTVRTRA